MGVPTGQMEIFASVAGLVVCGAVVFFVVMSLLRRELHEVVPAGGRERRGWMIAGRAGAALILALALAATSIGAVAVIENRAHTAGPQATSRGSSAATMTVPAIFTVTTGTAEAIAEAGLEPQVPSTGKWMTGDMHSHTFLTGGSHSQAEVAKKALKEFSLDWIANSEHGGTGKWDQFGRSVKATPRWWSLANWSWPIISGLRSELPGKLLLQGVEWNLARGGNASVGFASNDPSAVSEFDYRFDANSSSTSYPGTPPKDNTSALGAVDAVAWLQASYANSAYLVLNHPSRGLTLRPGDVRDYIAAGPDIVAGFEGMPGHQKQSNRGGYGSANPLGRTYQGADPWLAQVGGLWDSILGNGSRFHVFTNSDFHSPADDFWPGEYAKNWTFVTDPTDMMSLVAGLKSGRSFSSYGDLVDDLEFAARGDGASVPMGREPLTVSRGSDVAVTVRFHTAAVNNHGDKPAVDHIDLIAGNVTGPAAKGSASWEASTNPTARVVRTFAREDLQDLGDGWYAATCTISGIQGPIYLRLRATNLAPGTPGMTDAQGNPLMDAPGDNNTARAWASLWFYSNPLWVDVK